MTLVYRNRSSKGNFDAGLAEFTFGYWLMAAAKLF